MSGQALIILLRELFARLTQTKEDGAPELEVRFGTGRGSSAISKEQHDSVIGKALSAGFSMSAPSTYLRVSRETGARLEIAGIAGITSYCINESPAPLIASKQAIMVRKTRVGNPYDVSQYNFRVALSSEDVLHDNDELEGWADAQKFYRLLERITLTKVGVPFKIDVSVTKQGPSSVRRYEETGIHESSPRYEIEIELLNSEVGLGTEYADAEALVGPLKGAIGMVLSGLQGSNYPIRLDEVERVKKAYCSLIRPLESRCVFVGPSSISLQVDNIAAPNQNLRIPNVRSNYTITDKADGLRKLMFIDDEGNIYLIDTNLRIQFTGCRTENSEYFLSLLDGEHIANGKNGAFIDLYAAFDVYFIQKRSVCGLPFNSQTSGVEGRLPLLNVLTSGLNPKSISGGQSIRCESKVFHQIEANEVFATCNHVLDRGKSLEYETDGLIFTPSNTAVGASEAGGKPVLTRTWERSFKWKPPRFNTVDFMVTVVKDSANIEVVKEKFQRGISTTKTVSTTSYKSLILKVGFDDSKHGYLDPCKMMREPKNTRQGRSARYRPVRFYPTNPADSQAGMTHVEVRMSPSGIGPMLCEEGGVIEDNTVVEFRYDFQAEPGWRWRPLRVRYDKTAKLRSGKPSYGNAYHVANSNWHSIHNPVTEMMVRTGKGIGSELATDNIYYTALTTKSYTKALRDFHNLVVKKRLITGASPRNGTLIDLACGRAGDLPKWIAADLRFVYGLDLIEDNISNRLDGACARYLNYGKRTKKMPNAVFAVGDSTLNIRNGNGIASGDDSRVNAALFGHGAGNDLPTSLRTAYGIGRDGFDVCSIQFAIHYMFRDEGTLNNCLRNISEVTKVGGYFIGTCYDGAKVFNALRSRKTGGSISKAVEGKTIWAMTKQYSGDTFPATAVSVGMAIDVYQETIGKTFREYLVNLTYLNEQLEIYGFAPLSTVELEETNLPTSVGSFKLLFEQMMASPSKNRYGQARDLAGPQMDISFLNSFFIFKKVRVVDAESIARSKLGVPADSPNEMERRLVEAAIDESQALAAEKRFRFVPTGKEIVLGKEAMSLV